MLNLSRRSRSTQLILPLMVVSLVGCGGGGSKPSTPAPAPLPTFALAMPTSAPVLLPGQSTSVAIGLLRGTGTPQAVTFSLVNPPAGITGAFSPVTTDTNSSSLQLTAVSTLAPGSYPIGIQAIDSQGNKDVKTLTVSVLAQNFSLGAAVFGTLHPGSVQTASFSIARSTGFTGSIKLALTAPTGLSATFAGQDGDTGFITLTVDPQLAAGSYDMTIQATSTGSAPQSRAVHVDVAQATADGFSLTTPMVGPVLRPGAQANLDIAVQRFGGFSGAVAFSLEGAPAGLTGQFTPGGPGAVLQLAADVALAPGSYPVSVKGTAGSLTDSKVLTVRVESAANPGFQLDSPSALLMEQGIWEDSRWTATLPIHITRDSGFSDPVDITVIGLPVGLTVSQPQGGIVNGSMEISFKTSDTVLPGDYVLTLVAASRTHPTIRDARTLRVTLVKNGFGFAMGLLDGQGSLDWVTSLALEAGHTGVYSFAAYTSKSPDLDDQGYGISYPNPLTLTLDSAPAGVTASFQTNPTLADVVNTLTLTVDAGVAPGSYPIRIKAHDPILTRSNWFDVVLTVGKGTFYVKPAQANVEVVAGQSVSIPVELGRNDTFWAISSSTGAPSFLGNTDLSAISVSPGLNVTLGEASPAGAVTSVTIAAGSSMSPGDYTFTLRAARNGRNQDQVIPVKVTATGASPDLWIQGTEWGQTVLQSALRLVPGKPALLRAMVLSDRSGIASPVVRAVVKTPGLSDLTLDLTGPATVPTAVGAGQLDKSYTTLIPSERIAAGFTVDLSVDPQGTLTEADKTNNLATLTPAVGTGMDFDLRIVPIIHQGLTPNLPAAREFQKSIRAFWPMRSVNVTFRAPYVMSTVIPPPSDQSGHSSAWGMMRYEMLALRLSDGDAGMAKPGEYYFGMLTQSSINQVGVLGIHNAGLPAGLGLDQLYQDPADTARGLNTSVITSVHELGHGFNLRHAPDGQAGGPSTLYPYRSAKIGTWGLDATAATPVLYNPSQYFDMMSYTNPLWVSDFNYLNAFSWLESTHGRNWTTALGPGTPAASRTLISGFLNDDGSLDLHPVQHVRCQAIAPKPGNDLTVRIRTAQGMRSILLATEHVEDVRGNCRAFAFTLDGQEELQSIEILQQGRYLAGRSEVSSLRARMAQTIQGDPKAGFRLRETEGRVHLQWDAIRNPYAGLVHVDALGRRTTLALRLTGGEVDLPALPFASGGHYELILSDGLNPIRQSVKSEQ